MGQYLLTSTHHADNFLTLPKCAETQSEDGGMPAKKNPGPTYGQPRKREGFLCQISTAVLLLISTAYTIIIIGGFSTMHKGNKAMEYMS